MTTREILGAFRLPSGKKGIYLYIDVVRQGDGSSVELFYPASSSTNERAQQPRYSMAGSDAMLLGLAISHLADMATLRLALKDTGGARFVITGETLPQLRAGDGAHRVVIVGRRDKVKLLVLAEADFVPPAAVLACPLEDADELADTLARAGSLAEPMSDFDTADDAVEWVKALALDLAKQ